MMTDSIMVGEIVSRGGQWQDNGFLSYMARQEARERFGSQAPLCLLDNGLSWELTGIP